MKNKSEQAWAGTAEKNAVMDIPLRAAIAIRRAADMRSNGFYDAKRLRSQRDVIRDVMLSAAECDTWLTLAELRELTHYGEASISAQLRHLRKAENGALLVRKRRRVEEKLMDTPGGESGRRKRTRTPAPETVGALHSERLWEYRIERRPSVATAAAWQGRRAAA